MKILAIDTSAKSAGVALTDGRRPIAVYTQNVGLTHSETILPMIEVLLKNAKTDIDQIDMFACTVGPGSFTGVRIGVSTIKGLAFGKNKICVGVSTLESLARNIKVKNSVIVPVIDARQSRLYNAVFTYDGEKYIRITDDKTSTAAELADEIQKYGSGIYYVGDGYDIINQVAPSSVETPEILKLPSGYSTAVAALEKYELMENKEIFKDTMLFPEYLRPSQAERSIS